MATALRSKFSYHRRLFLLLVCFSWALTACFIVFQYGREKHFKAESLNAQFQLYNLHLLDALAKGTTPGQFIAHSPQPSAEVRITVIALDGTVCFDTSGDSPTTNHLDRPEVAAAITHGTGYTIRRLSATTRHNYFYSAMRGDSLIVRTAAPYSAPLSEVLAADREFLWFMLGVTLLMSGAAYIATRRLGHNITRLKGFAERAERGEQIGETDPFPHDELGDISNNIVRLYARLQKTTADRDREHALALHQEQEKIRIKKQLTNNINHELKTPVAAIQGYLETLLANPDLDAPRRTAFLQNGFAQAQRLANLLTDVTAIATMDEAEHPIRRERVSIDDIVAEIATDMQLRPAEQRLRVNCDFAHPLTIEGDPSLLTSIFRNLADNASAYSSGRDLFISLVDQDHEHYTILFADNGIGLDQEHLPHIFERFYRVDKGRSRKLGGTGLGLAVVKNAVLLHGGTITAHNRERGGLEFVFTLRKG